MKKVFLLDTNVLLHDPEAMRRFQDNDVVLPITVIEELDRFKKQPDMVGRNARHTSRLLDELRQTGNLTDGIPITPAGGTLKVMLCHRETLQKLPVELEGDKGDNAILAVGLELKQQCQCPVVLVSKDTNLRIKADALALAAEDYETDKVDVEELYSGACEVSATPDQIDQFFANKRLDLPEAVYPHQAVTLVDLTKPDHTAIAIADSRGQSLNPLTRLPKEGVLQIRPRNREQAFALELLLNDAVPLVTLEGKAGTGKTLLAIAAGLHQVLNEKHYTRLLISRPIVPMGRDLGYLPGDIGEKLSPWMQPLYDNFDLIFGTADATNKPSHWRRGHEELMERGLLQIEPLTYIRGRSIPKQFLIIDEAQNLTPHEVKTILTRAGEGTKIVLTGDVDQIDSPYLDAASNGISYVVERFKADPLGGHMTLMKGERSLLAERAATLL
ncbi:PhoH family protein [Halomicronema sp. CCY15110]|uniref:PhoH family protein n=1 Tax=Halomicronema sp. CCY15110 TaxID=2767773 RepID=UPI00194F6139|nr:PhoH family protein [Halomicronema sp. CCY15110]